MRQISGQRPDFSTLEVAVCMLMTVQCRISRRTSLELKTRLEQLLGSLPGPPLAIQVILIHPRGPEILRVIRVTTLSNVEPEVGLPNLT